MHADGQAERGSDAALFPVAKSLAKCRQSAELPRLSAPAWAPLRSGEGRVCPIAAVFGSQIPAPIAVSSMAWLAEAGLRPRGPSTQRTFGRLFSAERMRALCIAKQNSRPAVRPPLCCGPAGASGPRPRPSPAIETAMGAEAR